MPSNIDVINERINGLRRRLALLAAGVDATKIAVAGAVDTLAINLQDLLHSDGVVAQSRIDELVGYETDITTIEGLADAAEELAAFNTKYVG